MPERALMLLMYLVVFLLDIAVLFAIRQFAYN